MYTLNNTHMPTYVQSNTMPVANMYSASYLVWPLLGFFMKFVLFCSQKTIVRVKLKFGVQVRMPFLILCDKFET